MLKKPFFRRSIITLSVLAFLYFFLYRGNNRITVWIHHGLWLPSSAEHISFTQYPGIDAHLFNRDDDAVTNFDLPRSDLALLLKDQLYHYVIRVDSAPNHLSWTYVFSNYEPVPDSLINGPLPFRIELHSTTGDFLIFTCDSLSEDRVHINLGTDWN